MALANEEDMEAFFSDVVRYRPQELNQLASVTKFSRREIQHIYRGFKQEFLSSLSLVARGSLHDKIAWIFSLYDINHDGFITKHEMTEVVSAIYELLGHAIEPVLDAGSVERHVNAVFDLIDTNGDGVITLDEMERWCTRDEGNTKSLDMLNTVW
ncbi:Kv channel-interacting protein 1 [Amphibalanus amphitrite]|uniref:Kv channel-interacting protein 1 n=1 Tax=Amphibalanus amphitrite TaxID=1232801 RepID=A0A6A4WM02_AMPAM|nr:Kv channel-interacting protein 1 [Amphibalanus amphitrite]